MDKTGGKLKKNDKQAIAGAEKQDVGKVGPEEIRNRQPLWAAQWAAGGGKKGKGGGQREREKQIPQKKKNLSTKNRKSKKLATQSKTDSLQSTTTGLEGGSKHLRGRLKKLLGLWPLALVVSSNGRKFDITSPPGRLQRSSEEMEESAFAHCRQS